METTDITTDIPARKAGASKYDELVAKAIDLEPGECFEVMVPKGRQPGAFAQAVRGQLRRRTDRDWTRQNVFVTEDGRVCVAAL